MWAVLCSPQCSHGQLGFVNCVFATAFTLLLVSIGWLFYRPIIGGPLLAPSRRLRGGVNLKPSRHIQRKVGYLHACV